MKDIGSTVKSLILAGTLAVTMGLANKAAADNSDWKPFVKVDENGDKVVGLRDPKTGNEVITYDGTKPKAVYRESQPVETEPEFASPIGKARYYLKRAAKESNTERRLVFLHTAMYATREELAKHDKNKIPEIIRSFALKTHKRFVEEDTKARHNLWDRSDLKALYELERDYNVADCELYKMLAEHGDNTVPELGRYRTLAETCIGPVSTAR